MKSNMRVLCGLLCIGIGTLLSSSCTLVQKDSGVSKNIEHTDDTFNALFGSRVFIFNDSMNMKEIQKKVNEVSDRQKHAEFSEDRYALLFEPGNYKLRINVDYYTHVAGLGLLPGDVTINGAVQSLTHTGPAGNGMNVTLMFWRSAENMKVITRGDNVWAVSQAAPFRRMHIEGSMKYDLDGWGSGGYVANCLITGEAYANSQQQWFMRNNSIQRWRGGNWNMTFVGVSGAPTERWGERPYSVVEKTPRVREKPFLTIQDDGSYGVFVPSVRQESIGVSWQSGTESGSLIPIDSFYVAQPERDNAETINSALKQGKHLLLTPGIYSLESALNVERANTVILGLGMPTLIPQKGSAALMVDDVPGVVVAGIVADAGLQESDVLFKFGSEGDSLRHSENPTSISDLFCRVGGAVAGKAKRCLEIHSNDVIADHLWLWRADHGAGAEWAVNTSDNGLVVTGDHVTVYGLFNEHFQKYQTLWKGEYGAVYFYQSEIPYDPPIQNQWMSPIGEGYASYKVDDDVKNHFAIGLGIYSFFYNSIVLKNSVEAPKGDSIKVDHLVNFSARSGGIQYHLNGESESTLGKPVGAQFYKWNEKTKE
ncbi:MAG: coagulation factor 5/8 type domain-containing protein [Fibrobacterales bacterium]